MRRALALTLALAAWPCGATPQQEPDGPRLTLTLEAAAGNVEARLRAADVTAGGDLLSLLESGFPLYVTHRVEFWRARANWFDQFIAEVRWEVIVTYDPLSERFLTARSDGARGVHRGADELERVLSTVYRVPLSVSRPGRYYAVGTVEATPLNDSDLEETARWLRGDLPEAAAGQGGTVGDALARGARRLLVRAAGLSKVKLTTRSNPLSLPRGASERD